MSDLKTTIYNALNGKMRDAKQNEDNPSTKPRTKPAKNLPHQEIEESAAYQSGSGDMDYKEDYWILIDLRSFPT